MTADGAEITVTVLDSKEARALIAKWQALMDALKAMRMTCHNCGEKQTLSRGVTEALAALEPEGK